MSKTTALRLVAEQVSPIIPCHDRICRSCNKTGSIGKLDPLADRRECLSHSQVVGFFEGMAAGAADYGEAVAADQDIVDRAVALGTIELDAAFFFGWLFRHLVKLGSDPMRDVSRS
jgi:hypothetical protein